MTSVTRPGSPRAALSHRPFRWVFGGTFASNIGTWMQNAVLIAWCQQLEGPGFVGLVTFAQLGPTLLLAPLGGVLADRLDRRRMMMVAATVQGALSLALAAVASSGHPSRAAIVACVGGIGIAGALTVPAASASLPALVGISDLPGAVSLNSAQMNSSRVLGPLLAVLPIFGSPAVVFAVNAATYVFVVIAVELAHFDGRPPPSAVPRSAWGRFVDGIAVARRDHLVRRVLVTVSVFSLGSLAFIYQMPGFATEELGLSRSGFLRLFATFGLGAACGALGVGTFLAAVPRTRAVQAGLGAFAVLLSVFALTDEPLVAFGAIAACGFAYFVVITALITALQETIDDAVRGRVMGLWMMCWAGLVPVGSLLAGLAIESVGHRPVMVAGAAIAAALIPYARLEAGPDHA